MPHWMQRFTVHGSFGMPLTVKRCHAPKCQKIFSLTEALFTELGREVGTALGARARVGRE